MTQNFSNSTTKDNSYDSNAVQSYYTTLVTDMNNIIQQQDENQNDNIEVTKWNTYYYKKYKIQNKLLIFIICICITIIILSIIKRNFSYFDETAYIVIVGIILGFSILIIIVILFQIYSKDNMNFDEIDYGIYSGSGITMNSGSTKNTNLNLNTDSLNCIIGDHKKIANSTFLKKLF